MPEQNQNRTNKPSRGERSFRSLGIQLRNIDQEQRTAELAFSSETPVSRWWGDEVLSHDAAAVRMGRLQDGGALLREHSSSNLIGTIESARIDGDGVGRAIVRFSSASEGAEQAWREVNEGVLRNVSVGYLIHEIQETERKGMPPEVRITDWEPLEISLVAVPADASVGVGRDFQSGNFEENLMPGSTDARERDELEAQERTKPAGLPDAAGDTNTTEAVTDAGTNERASVDAEIRNIGKRFKLEPQSEELIELGGTVEEMRQMARSKLVAAQPVASPSGVVVADSARFQEVVRYSGKLRGYKSEESAYRMGRWAQAYIYGDSKARSWCDDHLSYRAMTEGSFGKGGVFVPDEMSNVIIDLKEERGVARRLANIIPMASDTLTMSRRASGTTAYWRGEAASFTDANPEFDAISLVAKKLTALTKISTELAEDAVIDIGMMVTEEIAYAFADKEDEAFINGDGTSGYGGIVGLRSKIIDGSHTAGAIDAASGVDTFAEVTADDLNLLMAKCPAYALNDAQWLSSQPAKALVFDALAQAAGGNTIQTMGERPRFMYLGYPIEVSQVMPVATTDLSNLAMLAFGDFRKAVMMGDRRGFTLQVLNEKYADTDEIGIKASERVDINWHDLGDNTNAGPVVCLIGE